MSNEKLNKKDTTPIFKIKSKEIKCPECGEICKIKFNNFKITLFGCKNGHKTNDLSLEQYNKMQCMDKFQKKCNNCKISKTQNKNDNIKLYKCLKCEQNICIYCKKNHNKEHNLIEYELKNYMCNIHNQKFNSFCNKCKINLCPICEEEHKKEKDLIYFRDIMPHINNKEIEEIKLKIEEFNNNIKEIIKILNKIMDKVELYSNIYYEMINNFDEDNINYQTLNNINEISNYNKNVINEMDKIINEVRYNYKINNIINLYSKLTENK